MPCVSAYTKLITIEELSGTADAHGFIDPTEDGNWKTYVTSYSSVMSRGGREFWKVKQVNAEVSHVWRCPYSKKLADGTSALRLKSEGVTYELSAPPLDIDLAHVEIEIQTKRAV